MSEIEISYTRPPDRVTVFRQHLVKRTPDCIITLLDHADVSGRVLVRGAPVLEPGAPIVWFTFPDQWHDVGRFHTADGRFTGYYANVLTPVVFESAARWSTTDLFLDVWLDEQGSVLLDVDELDVAAAAGLVAPGDARRARSEAESLIRTAASGTWPPPVCRAWTLERARAVVHGTGGTRDGDVV